MTCRACGGALSPWRSVPGSDPAWPGEYRLLRCERCGSAVTAPADDAQALPASGELHEGGAYGAEPRLARLAAPLLARFDRRRLALLERAGVRPGARLLDVGAGRGRFVAHARSAGYDASGIEPSRRGVEAARGRYGNALLHATVEEAVIDPASVDVITLWHVLEHSDDPGALLARVGEWLARGGVALIGVPNLDSWQARLGGARWFHLDVPRHRVHLTPAGLDALLAGAGLRALETTHVLAEHNPFGMWQSLVSRLTQQPSYAYQLLERNACVRARDLVPTLAALPLLPLAALLELIAGLARHGGTVAVAATTA